MLNTGVSIGLSVSNTLFDTKSCADYIKSNKNNSIRLLYPNLDFNYSYQNNEFLKEHWDSADYHSRDIAVGALVPMIMVTTKQDSPAA